MTKSYKEILEKCFLFENLPAQIQEMVFSELEVQNFKKGQSIYTKQEFEKSLGIILEGEATVYKENAVLNRLTPGSLFGAAAVFSDGDEYVTTIRAEKKCAIVFITDEELQDYFVRFPDMALEYIKFLSGRIRFLNRKIDSFTSRSAEDALWGWLCNNRQADNQLVIKEGYAELARKLNVSRASLYRALAKLEDEGKIIKNGSKIKICL